MPSDFHTLPAIGPGPEECWPELFGFLLPQATADDVQRLVADLARAPQARRAIVWQARRSSALIGAAAALFQTERVVGLIPPRYPAEESMHVGEPLLTGLLGELEDRQVRMVQALLPVADQAAARLLAETGFEHFADLEMLVATGAVLVDRPPASELEFVPTAGDEPARLRSVIAATYVDTLDCPRLNGRSDIGEVVDQYRATGTFDACFWLFVRWNQVDIGCLLLADFPELSQCELMYMGLVPAARGHGWGRLLVEQAQWLTRAAGRERLTLAVDRLNRPARLLYERYGFVSWDERAVWIKFVEEPDHDAGA